MQRLLEELARKMEKVIKCKCQCEGRGGEHACSCLPGIEHRCYPPTIQPPKKECDHTGALCYSTNDNRMFCTNCGSVYDPNRKPSTSPSKTAECNCSCHLVFGSQIHLQHDCGCQKQAPQDDDWGVIPCPENKPGCLVIHYGHTRKK